MQRYLLVIDDVAKQEFTPPEGTQLSDWFPTDGMEWIEAPESVEIGWVRKDGVFSAPEPVDGSAPPPFW